MNKQAKINAVIAATKSIFKDGVKALESELHDFAAKYYESLPENIEAVKWYKSTPHEYLCYVKTSQNIQVEYQENGVLNDKKFKMYVIPTLRISENKVVKPFSDTIGNYRVNLLRFPFQKVLINMGSITNPTAVKLQTRLEILVKEIENFMDDLLATLLSLSTEKKVKEALPNIVKFCNFSSNCTSLVDTKLHNKLNAKLGE